MRFSLATLLLICFWLALGLLVWVRRDAWVADGAPVLFRPGVRERNLADDRMVSPDGTRYVDPHYTTRLVHPHTAAEIYDFMPVLKDIFRKYSKGVSIDGFLDDDTVSFALIEVASNPQNSTEQILVRRRFPEWWWGHFYRPEVWAFGVLTVVLIVRAVRSRRGSVAGR